MPRFMITKEETAAARTEIRSNLKTGTSVQEFIQGLDEKSLKVLMHFAEKELRGRGSMYASRGNRRPMVEE